MTDAKRFTYQVRWSEQDQEYVGTCVEFPSMSWLDADQVKAFFGIVAAVRDVLEDMQETGETIPTRSSVCRHCGLIIAHTRGRWWHEDGMLICVATFRGRGTSTHAEPTDTKEKHEEE